MKQVIYFIKYIIKILIKSNVQNGNILQYLHQRIVVLLLSITDIIIIISER